MEIIYEIFAFIFGLVWGSFMNVVIYRVPEGMSLLKPRSICPVCKNKIAWYDNIPLLSYLILGGKCRHCGARISPRYPIIELSGGITFVLLWHNFHLLPVEMFRGFVFLTLLIILAGIDAERMILPDIFTLPGIAAGLAFSIFLPPGILLSLLGAFLGYFSLWIVYKIFLLLTGKEGLGFGDFKMLAMIGAFMGAGQLLPVIIISSLLGSLFGIALIIFKRKSFSSMLPYGVFLAIAAWTIYVFKIDLFKIYMGFWR